MTEESESLSEDAGKKKKFSGKKILLFVVVPLLLLLGAGAGVFFSGILDPPPPPPEEGDAAHGDGHGGHPAKKEAPPPPESHEPIYLDIPDVVVNLATTSKRPVFLKVNIKLQVASQEDVPKVEAVMPRIIDNFQVYLRELSVEDLQGSAGLYRLREELLLRITAAAQPARIKDVLFQQLLVQ